MIEAVTIGLDYSQNLADNLDEIVSQKYICGFRPYEPDLWRNLRLIKYSQLFEEISLPHKSRYADALTIQLNELESQLIDAQTRYDNALSSYNNRISNNQKITKTIENELRVSKNIIKKLQNKISPIKKALNQL